MTVNSVNSPVTKRTIEALSPTDQKIAMGHVVGRLREADWTKPVAGVHGAIILARTNKDCEAEFKAFAAGLQLSTMSKPIKALLEGSKIIEKAA